MIITIIIINMKTIVDVPAATIIFVHDTAVKIRSMVIPSQIDYVRVRKCLPRVYII